MHGGWPALAAIAITLHRASLRLSMILSENRFPHFGIML
jgi:hypothetical protein